MTTVEISQPITINGAEAKKLSLRRPKVRDMLSVDGTKFSDAEKELNLFANLCEVAPEDLKELDIADYQKLQKAYQDFLV